MAIGGRKLAGTRFIVGGLRSGYIVTRNSGYCGQPLHGLIFLREISIGAGMSAVISATTMVEAKQFDFLEGEWNAICRCPLPDGSWGEGPGSLTATKVLDGCVSLEFFEGPYQGTIIKGLGLRAFNPQTSQWEHTWTDTSAPGGFLVWRGRFEGGAIDLHGQWVDEAGRQVLSRLTWSHIKDRTAHWESHRSTDGGETWSKHWEIDFTRKTAN